MSNLNKQELIAATAAIDLAVKNLGGQLSQAGIQALLGDGLQGFFNGLKLNLDTFGKFNQQLQAIQADEQAAAKADAAEKPKEVKAPTTAHMSRDQRRRAEAIAKKANGAVPQEVPVAAA